MRGPPDRVIATGDFGASIILRHPSKHIPLTATRSQFGSRRSPSALGKLLFMQITPFRIEEYMGKHEFSAKYLLSSSDAESQTIEELLALEPGAHDAFLKHWCGYTESPGAPWLREVLATIYQQIHPDQLGGCFRRRRSHLPLLPRAPDAQRPRHRGNALLRKCA